MNHNFPSVLSGALRSSNAHRTSAFIVLAILLGSAAPAAAGPASGADGSLKKGVLHKSAGIGTLQSLACPPQGIACNATVSAELTANDCVLQDQSFYDVWTFQGVAGQRVRIKMRSTAFNSFLILYDPNGLLLDYNDDAGGGHDAQLIWDIDTAGTYTIWANSSGAGGVGTYTLELLCGQGPLPCSSNATTLCLNNGRFRVQAIFSAPNLGINNSPAQVVPLTGDTGYFWFFSANNVEIVLKVVDGRAFNGFYWVFYGALSDVEYTITVTDTANGAVKTYHNTAEHLASVADTAAFPGGSAAAASVETAAPSAPDSAFDPVIRAETEQIARLLSPATAQACTADGTTLCLNNGRFQVRAIFSAPNLGINDAPAQAVPLTSDTGYFWFFTANNVEIVIKAVDGRAFNNYYWVFYGALSDVQYTITVTDTVTGAVKVYPNAAGNLASVADTAAFPS